jgi:hypothetical protein
MTQDTYETAAAAWFAATTTPRARAARTPRAALQSPVAIAHREAAPMLVRGAHTGLTYVFGAGRRPLEVDARDAGALLASGVFMPAFRVARVSAR